MLKNSALKCIRGQRESVLYPARPDAYPLPACSHGAPVSDTVRPPARHNGDTRPRYVANV